jgi:hypothetical protein
MTVTASTAKSGPYAGAGTTGPFTVAFRFLENSHLQVIRTGVDDVDVTLTLTSQYTVTGAGAASGTVTLSSPLLAGEKLTIIRSVPLTQEADYVQNDAFPAESHERALDKLTMQAQQAAEEMSRSLTISPTVAGVSTALPKPSPNKVIGWNPAGNALENLEASTLVLGSPTAASLQYTPAGSGAVPTTVQTKLRETVSVKDFGAIGNGVADDTTAFQAALDASLSVEVPEGFYLISGTLVFRSKQSLRGAGSGVVRIRQTNLSAPLLQSANYATLAGTNNTGGVRRVEISGMTLEGTLSAGIPAGTAAQDGIQIFGYGHVFNDLHVRNFGGVGIKSEWATPGTVPDSGYDDGFIEAFFSDVKVYQCGLSGIRWAGPHDSYWSSVISFSNNMADVSVDKPNVWITSKANPQYIDQLHAWGNTSANAIVMDGPTKLSNSTFEGASVNQVLIRNGECEIYGGEIFAAGASSSVGIRFTGGTGVCIGYSIDTVIRGCNGGSVHFGTGVDSCKLNIRAFQTSGSILNGTVPTANVGNSLLVTAGGGSDNRATRFKHYHGTFTNLSLVDVGGDGLDFAAHGGEGVLMLPQRKTQPATSYRTPSGVLVYGRENSLRMHQDGAVGAILGQAPGNAVPADNLNCGLNQLIVFDAVGSAVTITNLVDGLVGSPFFLLMPTGGAEITLVNSTGNIRTKTGANLTRTGLGSNRLIGFVRARDGNYYQL